MLTNVHVKNLALIKESEIDLKKGFNILTGETGAGKSIIIGSINYCLGAKADKDVVREGAEYALVELIFEVNDKENLKAIKALDFPEPEDEGVYVLQRRIGQSKSVFKVNGETVTAKEMKELATYLIDIHGQHEHQSLINPKKQKNLLDSFSGEELSKEKEIVLNLYQDINSVKTELEDFSMDDSKREREISLARFEVDEIENARLIPNEEEDIAAKLKKMNNGKRIMEGLSKAVSYMDNGDAGACDLAGYAVRELSSLADYDDSLQDIQARLVDAEEILRSSYRDIREYMNSFEFSEQEFNELSERMDIINRLTLKYGGSVEKVLEYYENRKEELRKLEDAGAYTAELKAKLDMLMKEFNLHADIIHELRVKEAKKLSVDITKSLEELNFLKVTFEIEVTKKDIMLQDGFDEVSFNISLNPGERTKPVNEVASGGELSRIMLAIKTVLAKRDNIETLIFDEIDTGISGVTAWQVSKKMGQLSRNHQIICITHLPQIAAMADTHFKIEKTEKEGKTVTDINVLDEDGATNEVARLLGSEHITEASLTNAKQLIEDAKNEKISFDHL